MARKASSKPDLRAGLVLANRSFNDSDWFREDTDVPCLVEMLAPYKGRIYDPACGSGGMFVQSEEFVKSHGGKLRDISVYGQESNATAPGIVLFLNKAKPKALQKILKQLGI